MVNIEIKAQTTIHQHSFRNGSSTYYTNSVTQQSHKRIKVLRRPKRAVCSISTTNDDLTNNEPNEWNPSITIHASPTTQSIPYIRHAKLTHCISWSKSSDSGAIISLLSVIFTVLVTCFHVSFLLKVDFYTWLNEDIKSKVSNLSAYPSSDILTKSEALVSRLDNPLNNFLKSRDTGEESHTWIKHEYSKSFSQVISTDSSFRSDINSTPIPLLWLP